MKYMFHMVRLKFDLILYFVVFFPINHTHSGQYWPQGGMQKLLVKLWVNSLWPSDAIWQNESASTLAQDFNMLTYWPLWDVASFKSVISEHVLQVSFMSTSCESAHRWMPHNTSDDKLTLAKVMDWCCQGTSYHPTHVADLSPYVITSHNELTYRSLVSHYCIIELGQHWFR